MGILPRNDLPDVMPVINRINDNLARIADGETVRYLNINDRLADADGKLLEGVAVDRLHLGLKGYRSGARRSPRSSPSCLVRAPRPTPPRRRPATRARRGEGPFTVAALCAGCRT
jgi:hypothetical protein